MAYLEKYWNFTWSFLPFFQIRVFSLQVDLSQLILIKNQGSSHGILIKIKKRSGFLPFFLIRVFSLQVDLSQLILIKKQGSTHGNFIKILKFLGGFLPFFQISGVSDWALDQSHQESGKIYPIFMYTKWLQSITVIISEELCFVSHQYWSYHIVSLLPDHYRIFIEYVYQISLTLIQQDKGRFTLTYMSLDYLHASHTGLPGWMRVKQSKVI